jgi:hypothetical protein
MNINNNNFLRVDNSPSNKLGYEQRARVNQSRKMRFQSESRGCPRTPTSVTSATNNSMDVPIQSGVKEQLKTSKHASSQEF